MTILNTGSTKKFATGWENIFANGKGKKKPAAATANTPTAKKAKKKLAKKSRRG